MMTNLMSQNTAKKSVQSSAQLQSGQEWAPRLWAANFLGISVSTLIRWENSDVLEFPKPMRVGKCPLFNVEEVRQWALSHRG